MGSLFGELRYALRQFWAARIFTVTAVLTLALGIGGTTAIFTLIHAVMLRSLPVGDPSRLYRIGDSSTCCVQGGPQDRWGMFSYPLFERLKAELPEFEEITAFQASGPRLSVRRAQVDTAARPLRTQYVTGNYFSTLGIGAFGGRVLTPADDTPAASPVVVMSHHAWQTTYGEDRALIGGTVYIEGNPFTVVGVTPPGFFGETLRGDPPDLFIPLQQEPLINGDTSILRQPVSAWLRAIGRLRPGATVEGMDARLTGVLRQWMQHDSGYPANWMPDVIQSLPQQVIAVVPAGSGVGIMKEQYGRSLQILLAVCGLVLLIACANVANLLIARGVARRGQTAVRLAMGASRQQIVTQALVESGRSFLVRAKRPARCPGDVVGRARGRIDDARAQPGQSRAAGLWVRDSRPRPCSVEPATVDLHAAEAGGDLSRCRRAAHSRARCSGRGTRALQPAHRQLGRTRAGFGTSRAETGRTGRRVMG
jgi:predicted permease